MPSRRCFLKSTFATAAASVLADAIPKAVAQKADLTTAQMPEGGKFAKFSVQSLRDNVSLISGSGGNVLVLNGPEGKLIIDTGFATSRRQMSEAFQAISSEPLTILIDTHWHFDHTDGNDWMHAAGATIIAHRKTLTRMQHKQFIPEFEGVFPPRPSASLPTATFERTKTLQFNRQKIELARYPPPTQIQTSRSIWLRRTCCTPETPRSTAYTSFIDYSSGGGSINGMISACRENLVLAGKSTIVVCGHAAAGSRSDILSFSDMLEDVRNQVAKLKASGASAQEVMSRQPTASYDANWGGGFISPNLFTCLVYRGV